MARKTRVFLEGMAQHILLTSINEVTAFKNSSDCDYFIDIVKEASVNYNISIHAYILMPTFFEFLATPLADDSLSRFMQSVGRRYVAYFNKKYNHNGTLWQGRYKSSIVENNLYIFKVMQYIEQLSLISNKYNSIHRNLFNKKDTLVTCHKMYKELGFTDEERIIQYSKIFNSIEHIKHKEFIVNCLERQIPTSSIEFIKEIECKQGIVILAKRGRPKKINQQKGKKMYKNLVILDKKKHKDLKINPLENLNFAKNSTFIPISAAEAGKIGLTFPVVFSKDESSSLLTLIGLDNDCLVINQEGKWMTKYVPSFLRKYPFALANTKENPKHKVILIDEDASIFSQSKGNALFNNDEKSEVLENAIKFLTTYENQIEITKNVTKLISDSGILEDREISVGEGEEKKVLVSGFKVVDREKLNSLSDDILADWVRKGIINLIEIHLKSLENIQTLFNLAQQRQN